MLINRSPPCGSLPPAMLTYTALRRSSVGYFTLAVLACGAAFRVSLRVFRYVSHALSYPRFLPPNLSRLCTPLIHSRRFAPPPLAPRMPLIRIARLLAPFVLSHLALYPRSLRDYFRYIGSRRLRGILCVWMLAAAISSHTRCYPWRVEPFAQRQSGSHAFAACGAFWRGRWLAAPPCSHTPLRRAQRVETFGLPLLAASKLQHRTSPVSSVCL
jgi:hypothetical protein